MTMRRSVLTRLGVGITVLATSFGAPVASRAGATPTQHISASSRASLMRFDPRYALFPIAATVGPSSSDVSTVGLRPFGGAVSRAWATSAGFNAAGSQYSQGITAEQAAKQSDNAAARRQDAPTGGAAQAHARAVDLAGGVCPPADANGARVLSDATSSVAGPGVADVVSLEPGIVSSRSTVMLTPVTGAPGLAVRAIAETNVAGVRILDAYELRVVGAPRLEVTATGRPGGSSVSYTLPVVDVIDLETGDSIGRLDAKDRSIDLAPNDRSYRVIDHMLEVRLGTTHDIIATADGGFVRAQADLLQIRSAPGFDWLNLHVGSLAATASAPAGGVTTCDGGAPPAVDRAIPHVLVYELASGWEHTSIVQGSLEIADIANQTGSFTVEFTNDPSFLRPDKLAAIDAVYFNNTTGVFPWSADQKALFEAWLLCGGGTIATHASADANHTGWPLWLELIGAAYQSHPHIGYVQPVGEARVVVEDHESQVTEPWHSMESFRFADEYYKFRESPRGVQDINVLLSLDETTVYPWVALGSPVPAFGGKYEHLQPVAWTKTFRSTGRVFYTLFGHNGFAWDRPDFRQHMVRGVEWVTQVRPDTACFGA